MSLPSEKSLSALLDERRTFPPSEEFKKRANWNDPAIYDRAAKDPEGFWAEQAKNLDWFTSVAARARVERAVGQVVRGRETQRHLQLRGPARAFGAAQQSGDYVGGRAGRLARADVWDAGARSESLCQRAEIAGRRQGRPHRDLHGHGSRAGHRHARLRENRRGAFGRVRRIFGGGAARTHQRRQGQSIDYRGRRVAARNRGAAQGQRGRCADRNADHRKSGRRGTRSARPRRFP